MSAHSVSVILGTGKKNGSPSKSTSEGYQRLVLLAIANIADDNGFCYHAIIRLADAANVHRSTVNRHLDALIALGELRMFKRGHYQEPVFVMTIVDHPLSTTEIVDRLTSLDPRAEWRERRVDTDGDVFEEPVPTQGRLDLTKRSSQTATISENDTAVSRNHEHEGADLGEHADRGRENRRNSADNEIVAAGNNVGEIVAAGNEIVADSDEIVAVARRKNQRTKEPSTTPPTTTGEPPSGGGGGGDAPHPEEIAERWCEVRGVRFIGKIAEIYPRQVARFLEEHPPPSDEFLARALDEGIKHPSGWMFVTGAAGSQANSGELPDCERCDNRRLLGLAPNGHLVKADSDVDYETMVPCPECMFRDRKAAAG